ncbi:hypothetical protein, partial [Enterobacter hormaechei]|uniref:hypothetical protein n=1 Tax=Enterobacter hormaechei TaxID=158836 RepID=UPI0020D1C23B
MIIRRISGKSKPFTLIRSKDGNYIFVVSCDRNDSLKGRISKVRLDFGSTQTMLFPDVPSLNAIFSFSKILFLAMILYSSFGITIKSDSLFETFMISKKLVLVMLVF